MTFSGNASLVADSTLDVTNTFSTGVLLNGNIGGSGNLTKTGPGFLYLQGNNTYGGYTEVQAGTLRLRNGSAIADSAEMRVSGGTLDIHITPNETVGSLVMSAGSIVTSSSGVSLTASSFLFTNNGTVNARLIGASATLTKNGSGTVGLEYASGNTYGGGTTVNGGTLLINNTSNSATGTGPVTVEAAGSLAGNGTISGNTTISGSLRPGNSIGTLTVDNDVTWNAGSNWVFELGTAGGNMTTPGVSDLLNLTGAGSDFIKGSGSGWTFDFDGDGETGWYKLVDWTGTTGFAGGDFAGINLAPGLSVGSFVVDPGTSALYLQVIPEPSTALALLAGLGGLYFLKRPRRRG